MHTDTCRIDQGAPLEASSIQTWIDSSRRYLEERWKDHLLPVVGVVVLQLIGTLLLTFGYLMAALGLMVADRYPAVTGVAIGLFVLLFVVFIEALQVIHLGYMRGTLKSMRGEPFVPADLLSGVPSSLSLIGVSMVVMSVTCVGSLFCYVPGLLAGGVLSMVLPALADRNQGMMDALATGYDLVRGRFLQVVGWYFLGIAIMMVSAFIPMVGGGVGWAVWSSMQLTAYLHLCRERDRGLVPA